MASYLYVKITATNASVADLSTVIGDLAQYAVSSTSGASTTLTVNTSTDHGLSSGEKVIVSGLLTSGGVPLANTEGPVEGLYEVGTVGSSTSFEITISSALTTGQATAGQVTKYTSPSASALNPLVNFINGIQAGAYDATVLVAASGTNSASPAAPSGASNFINLK